MMHSQPRFASLQLLHLLLASPAATFLLLRPEVIFAPPKPTDAVAIRPVHPLEALPTPPPFFRRADSSKDGDSTTLIVDPKTCGFEDGLVDNAFQCVAETRSCTNDGAYIGCCDVGSTCVNVFPTSCIDFDGFESGLCDTKGSRTMCCTESLRGKCKTLTMLDTLTGIACGSEAGTGTILLEPTDYNGPISTVTAATRTTGIETGGILGSDQTGASSYSAQGTGAGVDTNDNGDGPTPSTGAIIGGVVGALVVFTIVICGAVWFVRRKKEPEDEDLSPHAPAPLPYCIPETAQTPPGSVYEYSYPYRVGHYSRTSIPSPSSIPSSPSGVSAIEPGRAPAGSDARPNTMPRS